MPKEAFSRVIIDQKLKDAGWDITDESQVVFEDHGIAGRADYVLKDNTGQPVAIIEAKAPDIDPYSAKQQAYNYAETQYKGKIDYIYLANDHIIYFWDFVTGGDASPVSEFFSRDDLTRRRTTRKAAKVESLTQKTVEADYFKDIDPDVRLRPYQIDAYNAIAKEYDQGKRAFLLEMATGTGKTLLASLIISKFLRTYQAQTVLFVVDRVELARQTKGTFERFLGNLTATASYWGGSKKNLIGANVVVATIQSLVAHGKDVFTPGYFDLIIHDEAHRSIYSPEARGALDYFVGATKIGLTATPKDYLKNVDLENPDDPRAIDARVQRDTYKYFDCKIGEATFRYNIQQGVEDGYLVKPKLHKMLSQITLEAWDGVLSGEGDYEDESYSISQLEKTVFVPKRNRLMMEEFLQYAEKNPEGEIGKTIVFAVNQRHATELEKILNELKPEYNGRFAVTITSRVQGAHDLARDFKNIDKKLPRVAVSVDMLTTGFDAPEVQNIVLARPVFEPTLYQQIKGRGTRLCPEINKDHFVIFDFCGVCKYFEEKYDWEAPLPTPRPAGNKSINQTTDSFGVEGATQLPAFENPVIQRNDIVSQRDLLVVGPDGDEVDIHMYQSEWEKTVKDFVNTNPEIGKLAESDDDEKLLELLNTQVLNKPKYYFNEENLIKSHKVVADIKDFFLAAMGKKKLPTREEQVEDWENGMLEKYGQNEGGTQKRYMMAKLIFDQFINDKELFDSIQKKPSLTFLMEPPFNQDFMAEEWIQTFGRDTLTNILYDIKSSKILGV